MGERQSWRLAAAGARSGAARKGIVYGPPMGRAIADLILTGSTKLALDAFNPGRFAK